MSRDPKSQQITLRITGASYVYLREVAEIDDVSVAHVVRGLIVDAQLAAESSAASEAVAKPAKPSGRAR